MTINSVLHIDENSLADIWQENRYFAGWDDASRSGFLLHIKLMPNNGVTWLRVCTWVEGLGASFTRRVMDVDGFSYPEMSIGRGTFEWLPIRVSARGHALDATAGHAGTLFCTDGDTQVELELDLNSPLPCLDWTRGHEMFGVGSGHLEQGLRWRGRIRVGRKQVIAEGLGWRDQSWGHRTVSTTTFEDPTWFAFLVHPELAAQVAVAASPRGGLGHFMERDGRLETRTDPQVTVVDGDLCEADFREVRIIVPDLFDARWKLSTRAAWIMSTEQLRLSPSLGLAWLPGQEQPWFGYVDLNRNLRGAALKSLLRSIGAFA